jgi:hypothetical protein
VEEPKNVKKNCRISEIAPKASLGGLLNMLSNEINDIRILTRYRRYDELAIAMATPWIHSDALPIELNNPLYWPIPNE